MASTALLSPPAYLQLSDVRVIPSLGPIRWYQPVPGWGHYAGQRQGPAQFNARYMCFHTLQHAATALHLINIMFCFCFIDLILVALIFYILFYYLEFLTSLRYFHKTGPCFVSCKSYYYPLPHGEFNTFRISHSSLDLISISDVFRKTRIT